MNSWLSRPSSLMLNLKLLTALLGEPKHSNLNPKYSYWSFHPLLISLHTHTENIEKWAVYEHSKYNKMDIHEIYWYFNFPLLFSYLHYKYTVWHSRHAYKIYGAEEGKRIAICWVYILWDIFWIKFINGFLRERFLTTLWPFRAA